MSTVHIIGAGLSGLSAAVELIRKGHKQIRIYEASPQAGGRCRSYDDALLGCEIDNGNHLLIQANKHSLAFLKLIGAESFWQQVDGYDFCNIENGHHFKFCSIPKLIFSQRHLRQQVMGLIITSALNTQTKEASRKLIGQMLWQIMKAGASGIKPFIPILPLSQAIVNPALEYLSKYGVQVQFQKRVKAIECVDGFATSLLFESEAIAISQEDHIILATSAHATAELMEGVAVPDEYESIINGHFKFNHTKQGQLYGVLDGVAEWLFIKDGIISTTTSAASRYLDLDKDVLAARLWADVSCRLKIDTPMPEHRIIIEKRATFRASPAQIAKRPAAKLLKNLLLAGDYTQTHLPATIEGSILSGKRAAMLAISSMRATS